MVGYMYGDDETEQISSTIIQHLPFYVQSDLQETEVTVIDSNEEFYD